MALSEEYIQERYGRLQPSEKVEMMIQDACDTPLIMKAVREYGANRFEQGQRDAISRASYSPGNGDMGG